MKIPFVKMHGCGNDVVVVQVDISSDLPWEKISAQWLDRRFGIGGDQLMVILPSTKADFRARIFEKDGRESEMCGNGIRCAARFIKEKGFPHHQISFETLAGLKQIEVESFQRIHVDMGIPQKNEKIWGSSVFLNHKTYPLFSVSMGNPHAILFVQSPKELEQITDLGPLLETHDFFPHRTNVELVYVQNVRNLQVRVWERSAGETLACGTGACAVAFASIVLEKTKSPVSVHFRGGSLEIQWNLGESIRMIGPAVHVFSGEVEV